MKKIFSSIFLILLIGLVVVLVGDWDNFLLRGTGYRLVSNDRDHVYLVDAKGGLAVGQQVVDIDADKNYIFILRMVSESMDCYDSQGVPTIITHYSEEKEFWIIDSEKARVVGPFSDRQFEEMLGRLDIDSVSLQIPNSYKSNSKIYSEWAATCR